MPWNWFAYINLVCTLIAAALWYVFPQLMAWPLLLGVIPWLLRLGNEGRWRWRTPFDWPLLLFVLTGLVSVWSAYNREMAWSKFWILIAGVLLSYALAAFILPGAPGTPREGSLTVALFLAFFGAAVSLYFLATHDWDAFPANFAALDNLGRSLQGPLPQLPGHRLETDVVGGILAMMAPFAAAVGWQAGRARQWPAFVLRVILLGLTLFGLLLSASRDAWLALLAALVVGFLWWLAALLQGARPQRRRWLFLGILSSISLLILVVLLFRPDVPQRLLHTLSVLNGGQNRLDLFRNSLILAQEYPFIGAGLGGFMMLYSTYAYLLHVGFIIHAHNLFLDVSIEQGLFAIVALLWMWGLFALALWRDAADGRLRPYLAAAALSLLTILLHGLVEDALYGSRALMLLFVPLAFALPYPQREVHAEGRRPRRMAVALGILLLLAGLLIWQRPLRSLATSNLAAVRQSQEELSRYVWPEWPIQDALRREIDLNAVVKGYERALALNPENAAANRRLGQIELSFAEYEDALLHLSTAFQRTPWDNATRQLLGEAYFANGQIEEGAAMWSSVTNAQNQLEVRAYWYEHIADEERRAALQIPPDG